ncbi:hypothetical protein FS764_07795 [Agrobacterium vitis]|uniref:Cap15 family cyclic dinucleotide receptor domain-containing protein n=1 Tax=Agrobacterium vitis TaxID=373 RepID=UPI001F34BCCF|nr:hypothetical protein [Agrobacterium vitis]MCF1466816.1 hypothetical protein [Agrobacterium vitis]
MLQLLPLRAFLIVMIVLWTLMVFFFLCVAVPIFQLGSLEIIWNIIKWSGSFVTLFGLVFVCAWRWIPQCQRLLFPYLGGEWHGKVLFDGAEGREESRQVTLFVHHNPIYMKLILSSEESRSNTLSVQAMKSEDVDDMGRLYYVYLNTRKEGGAKSHRSYRGVAILRIENTVPLTMVGDYFTDSNRRGRLKFNIYKYNPWWIIFR